MDIIVKSDKQIREDSKILTENDIKTIDDMLNSIDSKLLIVTHDRTDPDAMSSALVMRNLVKQKGYQSTIVYAHDTYHYQNQHLFNEYNLRDYIKNIDDVVNDSDVSSLDDFLGGFKQIMFVDTQTPEIQVDFYKHLPEDANYMLIDHHKKDDSEARDRCSLSLIKESGAGVSLLLNYMKQKEIDFSAEELFRVRALSYFGIETDTSGFQKMTDVDTDSLRFVKRAINKNKDEWPVINKIKNLEIPKEVIISGYAEVLQNIKETDSGVLYCAIPSVISKDTARISYYADQLMNLPWEESSKPSVVIVYGIVVTGKNGEQKTQLMASGRSSEKNTKLELINMFKNVFYLEEGDKKKSYAGGRKMANGNSTAGAVMPMNKYDVYTDDLEALSSRWQADNKTFFEKRISEYLGLDTK